jgi:hypothetical protein
MLSGVATTDGVCTFTVKATDSANPPQTQTTQYILQIAEPVAITTSPNFPNACFYRQDDWGNSAHPILFYVTYLDKY